MSMKKSTKVLAIIGITLSTLTTIGVLLFQRVKKLIEYGLKVKRLEVISASLNEFKMRITLAFTNNSDLQIVATKMEYDIFLNGVYLTTLKNDKEQVVYPNAISDISIDVDIDPQLILRKLNNSAGGSGLGMILNLKEQRLMLVTKLWIKFGAFSLPITIPFEDKIKNWKST